MQEIHSGANRLGADLQPIGAMRDQLLVRHPDEGRFKPVRCLGNGVSRDDDIAARAIDLVGKSDGYGLADNCLT